MDPAIVFCIAVVATAILLLLFVYCLATKYLNGDFSKVTDEKDTEYFSEDDAVEEEKEQFKMAPFEEYSEKSASQKISNEGFTNQFSSKASLKIILEHKSKNKCILGNLHSLQNLKLNASTAPQEIQFHVKLVPKNRFSSKTKWKPAKSKVLALTFTMGKITFEEVQTYQLCIRLYGISKGPFTRSICYGQCYVNLKELKETDKPYEFNKKILPKVKHSAGYISSDSEYEDVEFYKSMTSVNPETKMNETINEESETENDTQEEAVSEQPSENPPEVESFEQINETGKVENSEDEKLIDIEASSENLTSQENLASIDKKKNKKKLFKKYTTKKSKDSKSVSSESTATLVDIE